MNCNLKIVDRGLYNRHVPAKIHTAFAIHTEGLSKHFGSVRAVDRVNLKIPQGEIYALVGPNGSGKTTLMKLLVGLLAPTHGRAFIHQQDVSGDPEVVNRLFGYVSDDPRSYEYLTGYEFLVFHGRLHGMGEQVISTRIGELANTFHTGDLLSTQMAQYSRGTMQKVAVLAALLPQPRVLFIDEPIVGLDPQSIEALGELMRSVSRDGGTVFFSTHILQFAQKYATQVGIMHRGSIIKELGRKQARSLVKHFLTGTTFS